jgi:hypothetical protein
MVVGRIRTSLSGGFDEFMGIASRVARAMESSGLVSCVAQTAVFDG